MDKEMRQREIVAGVQNGSIWSMKAIAEKFSVHRMTIQRDIVTLKNKGLIRRVRGGITRSAPIMATRACYICGKDEKVRPFWRYLASPAENFHFCCGHCAFMFLETPRDWSRMLANDELWDRTGTMTEGWVVKGSAITRCCSPSITWFGDPKTAGRFQKAFGGEVFSGREGPLSKD